MIHKFNTVDAFIVFDLTDAAMPDAAESVGTESVGTESVGVVRSARKILASGASDLARSLTYTFASFEMPRSGASAGINATDEDRDGAIAKFVSEVAPMVAAGAFLPEPGTRVPRSALEPLAANDSRANTGAVADQAAVAGVVAAASAVVGGLEGRSVIIEGFGESGAALAKALLEQGGKVVAVTAGGKGVVAQSGFSPELLAAPAGVPYGEQTAAEALAVPADVLLAGSGMGVINHITAAQLNIGALVPYGPIPVTARALAVLGRAETIVVPDFISTAGPLFAWWPSGNTNPEAIIADAISKIGNLVQEIAAQPESMFLAACQRAEAFLATWQKTLPFGRPLAP